MSGEPPPAERVPWGRCGWAVVLAAFAVGFLNFPLRVVGPGGEFLPGDGIDNRLNNFILEHGYRCLRGDAAAAFWDAPAFYPTRWVTTWSDAHIGMLPIYALFRLAGLNPEAAFVGYFLVPFALNFVSAAWAIRRLGFGPVGAACGAYVFAFALPLVGQLTHVQLFPRFLVPPAIVFAWEFLRAPRLWRLAAAAACWAGQMYLSVYVGYFLALLLAVGGSDALIRFRNELPRDELLWPGWRAWVDRVCVVLGAGLLVMPLLIVHALGSGGGVGTDAVRGIAPRPGAWLTPPAPVATCPELADWTGLRAEVKGEQQLLPGLVPLAALCVGLFVIVRPGPLGGRGSVVAVAAWSAVLLALLVTPFGDFWLYEPLTRVPGVTGIRAVGRVVLVLLFPAGVAVAGCADWLVNRAGALGRLPAVLTAALVFGAVAGDQWLTPTDGARRADWEPLRYSRERTVARQTRLSEAMKRHPAPRVAYVFPSAAGPGPFDRTILQVEAMRAAQDLGVPCVNGYSGYWARGWSEFGNHRELLAWLTETNQVPTEELAGLVVIGDPDPANDPHEAALRAKYPPQPVAPRP